MVYQQEGVWSHKREWKAMFYSWEGVLSHVLLIRRCVEPCSTQMKKWWPMLYS
jgi:hypothetical protein